MASPSVAAGSGGEGSSGSGSGGAEPPGRHLPALFEQAAERLPGLLGAASKEQLLYLYARYKQTTEKRGKESKTAFGGPVVSSLYQEETIREEDKNIFDYCRENNIDYVTKAIRSKKVDVNVADEEGRALLHWACDRGHKELVSVLLQHAADVNSQEMVPRIVNREGSFRSTARSCAGWWMIKRKSSLVHKGPYKIKKKKGKLATDTTHRGCVKAFRCHSPWRRRGRSLLRRLRPQLLPGSGPLGAGSRL
ncbi:acyl-CoA-binding domain-containing protein 6 isoform X3 [Cygnus olor]|uniref:acyl-CoA-binding domain-containing protein 6 isoform X3 n=1 Tax=Cygnus olor TaxID=8869 RepID=UPI001ADE86C8|nr:acyl-CoA-binding domain-containing protein 6 isoform X3 [Cygnus olor]